MNLNPLDLRGPEFLLFYFVLSALTVLIAWLYRRGQELGDAGNDLNIDKEVAKDPYQMAYLRHGRDEVIRVAIVSLMERRFLKADGEKLVLTDKKAADKVRRPLDKAILMMVASDGKAQSLYTHDLVLHEADLVAEPLKKMHPPLVPNARTTSARVGLYIGAIGFLWLVAGTKIAVALSRGHTNIAFLVILAGAAAVVLGIAVFQPRTALGSRVNGRLQKMFARLRFDRESIRRDITTSELTFLAAVFGFAALPADLQEQIKPLHLHRPGSQSGDGW